MLAKITSISLFFLTIIFVISSSCTVTNVEKERYSLPSLPSYVESDDKVIMLAVSGPFEGALLSQVVSVPTGQGGYSLDVHTGGLAGLGGHLGILREKYEADLLNVSVGHFSSQALSKNDVKRVISFYKDNHFDALLLNADDFNILHKYHLWDEVKGLPFLNANWLNVKSSGPTLDGEIASYRIVTKGDKKIAIIGLTLGEDDRPDSKIAPEIIREESVAAFLRVMQELRGKQIDYRVLVTDGETQCLNSDEGKEVCPGNSSSILSNFLKRLPPQSLDMVLTGGAHPYQGNQNGISIVQNKKGGNILALRELVIEENQISSKMLPPVMLCHHFFQATNDCFFEGIFEGKEERTRLLQDSRFEKIPAKFLGFEVKLDPKWQL